MKNNAEIKLEKFCLSLRKKVNPQNYSIDLNYIDMLILSELNQADLKFKEIKSASELINSYQLLEEISEVLKSTLNKYMNNNLKSKNEITKPKNN